MIDQEASCTSRLWQRPASARPCSRLSLLLPGAGAQPPAAPGEHGEYRGAVASEPPAWFKQSFLDLEEDVREAAEAGKRLMIYFHQHGCPYCNALIEHNLAQKDIAERLQTRFDVIAVNLWGDREMVSVAGDTYTEKSFAEALQVQFTPTLMFFNEAGKIVLRLNGYLPPRNFLLALTSAGVRTPMTGLF